MQMTARNRFHTLCAVVFMVAFYHRQSDCDGLVNNVTTPARRHSNGKELALKQLHLSGSWFNTGNNYITHAASSSVGVHHFYEAGFIVMATQENVRLLPHHVHAA